MGNVAAKKLLSVSEVLRIGDGQVLYSVGDSSKDKAYILLAGNLSLKNSLGVNERTGNVGPGDSVGEEGLFEGKAV